MKKHEEIENTEEGFELRFHERESTEVNLKMPLDVMSSLKKVAASRDMSSEALIKLYIGQGLRQDLAKLFADRLLEKTAQVLTRHIHSEEEISAILNEIRVESIN